MDQSSTGSSASPPAQAGTPTTAVAPPNSTVLAIEVIPRESSTSSGSSGATGTTGSSGAAGATSAHSYRVTLRKDDGSTQVVTQDNTPEFRSGDRVNVTSGVIQR
jgi:hypothetical protein